MTLILVGSVLVLIATVFGDGHWGFRAVAATGAVLAASSVLWLPQASPFSGLSIGKQTHEALEDATLEQQQRHFQEWQQVQLQAMEEQRQRLEERQRDLAKQLTKFQEFMEYPAQSPTSAFDHPELLQASEKDREVHLLLEAEAARVYEKIRQNGYRKNGDVDLDDIRTDVLNLVQRVARVYTPNSENPLLETSFEQLARAASRICLHTLVLIERLPVDVKHYNINQVYGYMRKAIQGYGTYQQVAPWLTHLSRGAYMGRLAAGTNPVTLGAWWLATEVGRRGAQRLVENVVDRQAVSVLHDVVTVVGAEVANIYGPGFRQRDASWIYGTELTELLHRFPISRDSLTAALREITTLPLFSEYDRIYLYRCVANHRSAGFRLTDSAVLSRDERDSIAQKLEHFFSHYIHGASDADRSAWQNDVESRLDLKLSFNESQTPLSQEAQATAALTSVYTFLTSIASLSAPQATALLQHSPLLQSIAGSRHAALFDVLQNTDTRFEPPDLDPSAEVTQQYLMSLADAVIASDAWDPHLEELVLETACYFRRSREDAAALFHEASIRRVGFHSKASLKLDALGSGHLRAILPLLNDNSQLQAVFSGISFRYGQQQDRQSHARLVAVGQPGQKPSRLLLLTDTAPEPVWTAEEHNWSVHKVRGYVISDCEISGGIWQSGPAATPDAIVIAGVLGSKFDRTFGCLLQDPVVE